MKSQKKHLLLTFLLLLLMGVSGTTIYPQASIVTNRLKTVQKAYPQNSRYNHMLIVNCPVRSGHCTRYTTMGLGGCDGLVAFTTMYIFHNPYAHGTDTYQKIGKTVSTSSPSKMRAVLKKAKKGDVISLTKNGQERHVAMFMSCHSKGVKVYEANFNSRNKVWKNHLWPYSKIRLWFSGADSLSVYRSKNKKKVNAGKTAKKLPVGSRFKVNGVTYQVTRACSPTGTVKVVNKSASVSDIPRYIGANYDRARSNPNYYVYYLYSKIFKTRYEGFTYSNYYDEQFFTVTP